MGACHETLCLTQLVQPNVTHVQQRKFWRVWEGPTYEKHLRVKKVYHALFCSFGTLNSLRHPQRQREKASQIALAKVIRMLHWNNLGPEDKFDLDILIYDRLSHIVAACQYEDVSERPYAWSYSPSQSHAELKYEFDYSIYSEELSADHFV